MELKIINEEEEAFYWGTFIRALSIYDLTNKYGGPDEEKIKDARSEMCRVYQDKEFSINKLFDRYLMEKKLIVKEKQNFNHGEIFTRHGQARNFFAKQPYFFDKSGMFWIWNKELFCWEISDEVSILNLIHQTSGQNIISSKDRTEIINVLKQEGRKNIPKEIPRHFVQFKDKLVDLKTLDEQISTPEYFATNPISYALDEDKFMLTPHLDKLFEEWVGKDHVQTLYEIIAYCCLQDYPIHRLFCFVGGGMNGKSCFLRLLRKFIGEKNVCSTELDTLMNSRFEVTRLHKKLICIMGETNFNELTRTSMLKKLTGQDVIGFEYKNKTPFEDVNYAKIIIATNNLPATTDKTIGFYRRWMIIDFPNQFTEEIDILSKIPEEEYSYLARKVIFILQDLIKDRKFTNEGGLEQRMERYESKSNFLEKFVNESCSKEDINGYITKKQFYEKFCAWSRINKHRDMTEIATSQGLKKIGIDEGKKRFDWMYDGKGGDARVWFGLTWK